MTYKIVYGDNIERLESRRRFGYNGSIGATETLISSTGGATPYLPQTAVAMEIVSNDATDTSAGAGARSVTVVGLDANWKVQTETLATNGLSVRASSYTWRRIYTAFVSTSGTYGSSNAGTILVRQPSGTTFLTILPGNGESMSTHYCTAKEETIYIHDTHYMADATKPVSFTVYTVINANTTTACRRILAKSTGVSGVEDIVFNPPIKVLPYTDIYVVASAAGAGGLASVEMTAYSGTGTFNI